MRKAFTLVELLVVIAIIGILLGISLPAVQSVREIARKTGCRNNLHQLVIGMSAFEAAFGRYPPGQLAPVQTEPPDFDAHPLLGHLGFVLPYIEQTNFQSSLGDLKWSSTAAGTPWYLDPATWTAASRQIPVFRCPSDAGEPPLKLFISAIPFGATTIYRDVSVTNQNYQGWTNYLGCSGDVLVDGISQPERGIFYARSKTTAGDIRDGLSNTILIGELIGGTAESDGNELGPAFSRHSILSNGLGSRWGFFDDIPGDGQDTTMWTYSSRHPARIANFAFADGSIRGISAEISPELLTGQMTRNGHEIANLGN